MRNIRLTVEYDGRDFSGWQVQPDKRTVQGEIEKALFILTGEKIRLIGSGRTDSGVHSRGQVANFKTESKIPEDKFYIALNTKLPEDIRVIKSEEVDINFHSRFDAKSKCYRYSIYNSEIAPSLFRDYFCHVPYKLDIDKMKIEAEKFIGEHDFRSFMASNTDVKDTVRIIYDLKINQDGKKIYIDIAGNGFLYNMVRIMVGTLVDIGRGKINMDLEEIILKKNRSFSGQTVVSKGLSLEWVKYSC